MKQFAIASAATLGVLALGIPAQAAVFAWNIEYANWWNGSGGGSISGTIAADEADALDGIISFDEMKSWLWTWSGNASVPAFSISSKDVGARAAFNPSFYVDGRANLPLNSEVVDGDSLDQGSFISELGSNVLDFQTLLVASYPADGTELLAAGNPSLIGGQVAVSDPALVPEPATALGLLGLLGAGRITLKRRHQAA